MTLTISPVFSLPAEAVTETFAILAVRGAGKSNAAVVMAESMYHAGLPWVAVDPKGDWWGIRSERTGKGAGLPVPIFGALGRRRKNKPDPDLPLEDTSGELIADLIVDERVPCVLDVSGFSEAGKVRFLTAFGQRLFERNEEPLHLFLEECDDYMPQKPFKEQTRLLHVYTKLLKQGRSFGIGATLVSQRSAVVNKNALTQVGTLIAMRTTSPQDRRAIREWVESKGSDLDIVESLPSLKDGEAWVWSPDFLRDVKRIRFRRRDTFDSGATPKVGSKRTEVKTVADVDLAALQERMASTIERAKADDPKELRKRIAGLERELRERPEPEPVVEHVEIPVIDPEQLDRVESMAKDLWTQGQALLDASESLTDLAAATREAVKAPLPISRPQMRERKRQREPAPSKSGQASRGDKSRNNISANVTSDLSKAERLVLTALAQYPQGRSISQLALLTGYRVSGGFRNTLSALRTTYFIVGGNTSIMQITTTGLDALGSWDPLPTGRDLADSWIRKLPKGESTVLQVLVGLYPEGATIDQLAEMSGYAVSGGFRNILSKLRTLELLTGRNIEEMFASEEIV